MVVKLSPEDLPFDPGLRVVLSHMVVKHVKRAIDRYLGLRVVLSHMVVKPALSSTETVAGLRVVLSHMVVKLWKNIEKPLPV